MATSAVRFGRPYVDAVAFHRWLMVAASFGMVVFSDAVTAAPVPGTGGGSSAAREAEMDVSQGALRFTADDGTTVECPLKHTDVRAEISGFIARVKVTQTFHNPSAEKIEAIYVFPLPHQSAVDRMTMTIGERRIVGVIKRRSEAQKIYQQAVLSGQTAALLEQERPNIFTQSVGNIEPGSEVRIEISYVDVLDYDSGEYEFRFPMVVGPRYNPGSPISSPVPRPAELNGKVSPPEGDTTRVPDASRINPPVLRPGMRNGHDIALQITLDAGVPVQGLEVANHRADISRDGDRHAIVRLASDDAVPNKDFVLRYHVAGSKPQMALLAHTGEYSGDAARLGNGYFMLMIQPSEEERLTKHPPREIVFLVDVSGSMRGQPTDKVRSCMQHMLAHCRPQDTLQVITFAGRANPLFAAPVPVTEDSMRKALDFTRAIRGSGGTEMLKGVRMAIDQPLDPERLRVIVMLTDGYIGNEAEIIRHVGTRCGDRIRFWALGIGSSPNMFLVDGVALQGGGMGKKLGLNDDDAQLASDVMTRIQRAQLSDVRINWGGAQVAETYPSRIPELWAGRPVIVFGRYVSTAEPTTRIIVHGRVEGQEVSWPLEVDLPSREPKHDVLAKVWARHRIEDLMHQTYYGGSPAVEETVTAIALDYGLMSQYTSFVAVDATQARQTNEEAKPPRRMLVPVPLPDGTQWEGFFGPLPAEDEESSDLAAASRSRRARLQFTPRSAPSPARRTPVARAQRASGGTQYLRRQNAPPPLLVKTAVPGPMPAGVGAAPGRGTQKRFAADGGYGGRLARSRARGLDRSFSLSLASREEKLAELDGVSRQFGRGLGAAVLGDQEPSDLQRATESLQQAQQAESRGDLLAAHGAWMRAYYLDSADAFLGHTPGQIAADAISRLNEIRQQQIHQWAKAWPMLETRLDLVLRDVPVERALQIIAERTGVTIVVTPGSFEDAAALKLRNELRETFLDLRGATLAQALDWLLQPASLDWRPDGQRISVSSLRRRDGQVAWVYDVASIMVPISSESQSPNAQDEWLPAVRASASEILAAFSSSVHPETTVRWLAPGQIVVLGTARDHTTVARLVRHLADPTWKAPGNLTRLHRQTVRRSAERAEQTRRSVLERERAESLDVYDRFAWPLLAASATGRVDLEALTELQVAWARHGDDMPSDDASALVTLRCVWAIAESARALPECGELQQLAALVRRKAISVAENQLRRLVQRPTDVQVHTAALYATLALGEALPDFAARAVPQLVSGSPPADSTMATARVVTRILLEKDDDGDHLALAAALDADINGVDLTALTALACRKAGPELWRRFRTASHDLLGQQPLPGAAIVWMNHIH